MIRPAPKTYAPFQWLKTGTIRTFSILLAVILNLALFSLMIHLVRTEPGSYQKDYEKPHPVNFIRVKKKETPPPEKPKPKPKPEPKTVSKKEIPRAQIAKSKPTFDNLQIPYELNPRLPASDFTLPDLDLKSVSIDAPGLKDSYGIGELDAPLIPLVQVPPIYPMLAKRRGIEGWVKVKFLVNKQGRVEKASILDSSPEKIFDQAVLNCVLSWRFKPGTKEGVPVKAWAETTIRFELK